MSELQCVARLKIHEGKLDEFKGAPSLELIEKLRGSPVQVYTPFLAK